MKYFCFVLDSLEFVTCEVPLMFLSIMKVCFEVDAKCNYGVCSLLREMFSMAVSFILQL